MHTMSQAELGALVRTTRKPWLDAPKVPGLAEHVPLRSIAARSLHANRGRYVARTPGVRPRPITRAVRPPTPRPLLAGLGDTRKAVYEIEMKLSGVPATVPFMTVYNKPEPWQQQLDANGQGAFKVLKVRFLGSENADASGGWYGRTPTSDLRFLLTVEVPEGGSGVGAMGDILDTVLDALKRVGTFMLKAFDATIVRVAKVRDTVTKPLADLGKFGLTTVVVLAAAAAGVIYVLGKSRVRTSRVAFGE